jgi:hypothetical protein
VRALLAAPPAPAPAAASAGAGGAGAPIIAVHLNGSTCHIEVPAGCGLERFKSIVRRRLGLSPAQNFDINFDVELERGDHVKLEGVTRSPANFEAAVFCASLAAARRARDAAVAAAAAGGDDDSDYEGAAHSGAGHPPHGHGQGHGHHHSGGALSALTAAMSRACAALLGRAARRDYEAEGGGPEGGAAAAAASPNVVPQPAGATDAGACQVAAAADDEGNHVIAPFLP